MRILLPLADALSAADAIAWAHRFQAALHEPPRFVALHVVPIRPEGASGVLDAFAADDLEDARARFAALIRPGDGIDLEVRAGSPGVVICEAADAFDLVVLGASGRTQLSELLLGSTSAHVVHHAPCHVLVLRPRREPAP